MQYTENEFFDEYKRVDAICRDMFMTEKGVGAYIEQMEIITPDMQFRIINWGKDYNQLKRMRRIRNKIAHENGYVDCSLDDLNWLKDFHVRLLNRQDPLAVAGEYKRVQKQPLRVAQCQSTKVNYIALSDNKSSPKSRTIFLVVFAIVGVLVAVIICAGLIMSIK